MSDKYPRTSDAMVDEWADAPVEERYTSMLYGRLVFMARDLRDAKALLAAKDMDLRKARQSLHFAEARIERDAARIEELRLYTDKAQRFFSIKTDPMGCAVNDAEFDEHSDLGRFLSTYLRQTPDGWRLEKE